MATGDEVAALELLQEWFEDEGHWTKGSMGDFKSETDELARTCLLGGLQNVFYGPFFEFSQDGSLLQDEKKARTRLAAIIREQFPERAVSHIYVIPDFNDHPATGIADVRLVVGKALAQAREEEGL